MILEGHSCIVIQGFSGAEKKSFRDWNIVKYLYIFQLNKSFFLILVHFRVIQILRRLRILGDLSDKATPTKIINNANPVTVTAITNICDPKLIGLSSI